MKLSGWQRLWVVFSIIYTIPIILLAINDWPSKEDIELRWVFETIEIVRQPDQSTYEISQAYSDLTHQELVNRIHEKHKGARFAKQSFDKVDDEYRKKLSELNSNRFKSIGFWVLVWATPIICVYLLGLSIGWVYRGFKST